MGRAAMQSRHFVVSIYGDDSALKWMGADLRRSAWNGSDAECVVTEIAPNIYATSPLAKQVAEAMTRQITRESGDA